jgi:hypothetical protein
MFYNIFLFPFAFWRVNFSFELMLHEVKGKVEGVEGPCREPLLEGKAQYGSPPQFDKLF